MTKIGEKGDEITKKSSIQLDNIIDSNFYQRLRDNRDNECQR